MDKDIPTSSIHITIKNEDRVPTEDAINQFKSPVAKTIVVNIPKNIVLKYLMTFLLVLIFTTSNLF